MSTHLQLAMILCLNLWLCFFIFGSMSSPYLKERTLEAVIILDSHTFQIRMSLYLEFSMLSRDWQFGLPLSNEARAYFYQIT